MKYYILGLLAVLLAACNKEKRLTSIHVSEIKELLSVNEQLQPIPLHGFRFVLSEFHAKNPLDTLFENTSYLAYEDAVDVLEKKFQRIDTQVLSSAAKQYKKALVIADFIYASSSYILSTEFEDVQRVNSLAITPANYKSIYALANSNRVALYCGQRSALFKIMVDSLLQIPVRVERKEGGHIFPVITIGGREYVVDPFDPFVAVSSFGTLVDIASLKDSAHQVIHTKRYFGYSRSLITKKTLAENTSNGKYASLFKYYKEKHASVADSALYIGNNFYAAQALPANGDYVYAVHQVGRPEELFDLDIDNLLFTYCNILQGKFLHDRD
ncbi:MAG: hypothetical protein KF872_06940 [Chitinophagales bacterium]|nr:hypothetical protein [Chitinophagales bacterium]